jgi:hypothetical protein
MEHLSSLIHKLKEQFEQNVPAEQMLNTVRQIESALSARSSSSIEKEIVSQRSTGKVAVMMPAGMKSMVAREITEQHVKYAPAVAVAEVEPEILSKQS